MDEQTTVGRESTGIRGTTATSSSHHNTDALPDVTKMEPRYLLLLQAGIWLGCFSSIHADSDKVNSDWSDTSTQGALKSFLARLSEPRVDLVVVLDRSEGMGRYNFYVTVRKLAAHVLRHHAVIAAADVRLAVVTFAQTARVDIDGISRDPINKCDLFNGSGNGGLWENVTFTDENWSGTNVDVAFRSVIEIFQSSRRGQSATRLLWILTDGNYKGDMDPQEARNTLLESMGVAIYATGLGPWLKDNVGNVRNLLGNDSRYGNLSQWLRAMSETSLITTKFPPRLRPFGGAGNFCQNSSNAICDVVSGNIQCREQPTRNKTSACGSITCLNGGACVPGLGEPVCKCEWNGGYQGDRCQANEDECLEDACDHGVCQDGVGTYACACEDGYRGRFCEDLSGPVTVDDAGDEEEAGSYIPYNIIMIAVIVGSVVMVIIIVAGITCLCTSRRRNRKGKCVDPSSSSVLALTESAELATGSSNGSVVPPAPSVQVDSETGSQLSSAPYINSLPSAYGTQTGSQASLVPHTESVTSSYRDLPPPPARPDLLTPVLTSEEEDPYFVDRRSYLEVFNYVNLPEHKNMGDWDSYIADLTSENGLQRATMVRLDRAAWITSDRTTFLPTLKEMADMMRVLHDQQVDVDILVKTRAYRVDRNDGLILRGVRQGDRLREVVCVGKTRQFLVLGLIEERTVNSPDQCFIEVDWVRNHIKEQGL